MSQVRLSNYTMQVVVHGSVETLYVEIEESGIRPADIYKQGVVLFNPRLSATFGEIDIDTPYLIGENVPIVKGVPVGTIMYIRYQGKIEKMTFYSPEEFRKLVTKKHPIVLGFCNECGIPYFNKIKICENCGIELGEVGMK